MWRISKVIAGRLVLATTLLSMWELIGRASEQMAFFVSMPSQVAPELFRLVVGGHLYIDFVVTASEALIGASLGTLVGAVVGLSFWYSRTVADTVRPFVLIAGSIPLIAFAPLFIVWFGIGFWMKVALAFFSTAFPALAQSYRGANSVAGEYSEVLEAMRATRRCVFQKVIVPGALTWVLSSMRLNVGVGLLGAFLGEFIASEAGLGYVMLRAAALYNVPRAFAAATGIGVLALVFDFGAQAVERRKIRIMELLSVPHRVWRSQ